MVTLTQSERETVISSLILNCAECGWTEDDRGVLNSMSDRTLAIMAHQAPQGTLVLNYMPRFDQEDLDMAPPPLLTVNTQQWEPEFIRPCGCQGDDLEMAPPVINYAAQAAGSIPPYPNAQYPGQYPAGTSAAALGPSPPSHSTRSGTDRLYGSPGHIVGFNEPDDEDEEDADVKAMTPPKIDWVAEENQRRLAAKSAMTGTGIYVQPHSVAGPGDGRGQAALTRQSIDQKPWANPAGHA